MLTTSEHVGSDVWAGRFDERAGQHAGVQSVEVTSLDQQAAQLLGPSLAIFQLGESGTGEHLFEAARRSGTDLDYQRCLERSVAEEQEHARMLAVVLEAMRVPLRHSHWTDGVFVLIRRAHSLRTEVLVLMVAEVVALSYYGALASGVRVPDLRDVFDRIHADEVVHVAFHSDTLPEQLQRFPRPVHAPSTVGVTRGREFRSGDGFGASCRVDVTESGLTPSSVDRPRWAISRACRARRLPP